MRVRLNEKLTAKLCELPESGMGYQRVDVRLSNGQHVRRVLVVNPEFMEWPDDRAPIRPDDLEAISVASE